jgi:hypothetical protein
MVVYLYYTFAYDFLFLLILTHTYLSTYPIFNHNNLTSSNMEKAKAAVGNFLHKDGKHDTTVHEVNLVTFPVYMTCSNYRSDRQPSRSARKGHSHTTRECNNSRRP